MLKIVLLFSLMLFTARMWGIWQEETPEPDSKSSLVISVITSASIKQQYLLEVDTAWASDLEFSPDGTLLAVVETGNPYKDFENTQGKVSIWDVMSWQEEALLTRDNSSAMTLAFNSIGNYLAVGTTTGEIQLWGIYSQQVDRILNGSTGWVNSLTFDPGDNFIVSATGFLFGPAPDNDPSVRIWYILRSDETIDFTDLTPEDDRSGSGLSVAYSPDGTIIAAGMTIGEVHLWDSESTNEISILGEYAWADDLLFTPDSSQILFAANDGVRVWNIDKAIETFGSIPEYKLIAPLAEKEFIFSLALNPDGTVLAVGYQDGTVRLWDIEKGERLTVLEGHTERVVSLDFNPDGTLLASGGADGTVRLWGVAES